MSQVDRTTPAVPVPAAAISGGVAAGAALAAGEVVAAVAGSAPSPMTAVGDQFVDRFAASLKELAVALFGTNDKTALLVGIVVVSLLVGATLGIVARPRRWVMWAGLAGAGLVGAVALASDPRGSFGVGVLSTGAGVVVGGLTYELLSRLALRGRMGGAARSAAVDARSAEPMRVTIMDRRGFLVASTTLALGAMAGGGLTRRLRSTDAVDAARRQTVLPRPVRSTLPPVSQPFVVDGLTSYVTPVPDFFRIDTALSTPLVDVASWSLRVDGLVDRPFELTYDELLALDSVEETVTIQCVSNEVGGRLVGTAVWQGVPLPTLLERARVQAGAEQVVGRSVDGWTAGFPLPDAVDGRTALVAYAMNGEPLPADHGFPARLIVAGLYGYVSATKWLERIELTTWDGVDGYWIPRGWAKRGPVKTASRIDVPAASRTLAAGEQVVAGVAWAPDLGISAVEVQVDDGPWLPCELGRSASSDTWVQWRREWQAAPGEHRLRVRAVDSSGNVQTEMRSAPAPDGATGWHERTVRVT